MNEPSGGDDEKRYAHSPARNSVDDTAAEDKLMLADEELAVSKETVETGRLRVSKQTHTTTANIEEDLIHEDAIVETVAKGHRIFVMPVTRVEGDTTIIPVVEEVIYTEKRLVLKEEIRVTRRQTTKRFHDTVTLRHQEAVVSRIQSATEQSGSEPGPNIKSTWE